MLDQPDQFTLVMMVFASAFAAGVCVLMFYISEAQKTVRIKQKSRPKLRVIK